MDGAALAALNLFVVRRLIVTEYLDQMGSIEAAYIGLSRWILAHPWELDWFPLWYAGIPFQNVYPPLLHLAVAAIAALCSVSPAQAHHWAGALAYACGPVALYALARTLSRRRYASLAAALAYSLVSPAALLVRQVAADMGSVWAPRRLQALVVYGEGPHILSLTLVPLALLLLHRAIESRSGSAAVAAAAGYAAVALTNWLGAFTLAVFTAAYLAAYAGRNTRALLARTAAVGLLAYGLTAPWIPPSTIAAVRANAQYTVGHYPMTAAQAAAGAALLLVAAGLLILLRRLGVCRFMIFASLASLATAVIALGGYWFGKHLVPQPERYHLEMEMALVLIAVFPLAGLLVRLPRWGRAAIVAAAVAAVLLQIDEYSYHARKWVRPAEVGEKAEYRLARWLDENLPGRRVFATGSIKFWLNAFADNPQLGGGFDQGITNPLVPRVTFGIPFTERDGERCARWLRAYGIDAIVVSGPETADAYRDYRDPGKFEGVLAELYRLGDDVIYEVRRRNASLAHVIPREAEVRRGPVNIEDEAPLRDYVAALEDAELPRASWRWETTSRAQIETDLPPDHLLSVQVSFHPGWRARVNGAPAAVRADGLGLMVIEPDCTGRCRIELVYDGGLEMAVARLARGAALGGCLGWMVVPALRRRLPVRGRRRAALD